MIEYIKNGEKIIREKIAETHALGKSVVRITGNYEISGEIVIPSHTTLILEDCRLRLADGVYSRIFTNEAAYLPDGLDRDIHILGVGIAELDGGVYNGLNEKNAGKDGLPPIWANNFIVLSKVDGFSIEKVKFVKSRWYSIACIACCNGTVRDIDFDDDCRKIDKVTGEIVYGLVREEYPETVVKNADGIDICAGCHDILIENVTGFTEDDSVAIASLFRNGETTPMIKQFGRAGDYDVYNIVVRNVRTSCFCAPVRLLNQGGPKLYNILIDGVFDASLGDKRLNHGYCGVMVGDYENYGDRLSSCDETYNITVKNVYSRAEIALLVCGGVTNLKYENINAFDSCKQAVVFEGATLK